MKPSVHKIMGGHLTACDKRNILDCIEYLRDKDHHNVWLCYKRSPKRYCVTPDIVGQNIYWVLIEETYRTDWGERRKREWTFNIEVRGIEPLLALPPKASPQFDLFDGMNNGLTT